MLVIGCFIALPLLVAGGRIGLAIGGNAAGFWGGAGGFVIGCAIR